MVVTEVHSVCRVRSPRGSARRLGWAVGLALLCVTACTDAPTGPPGQPSASSAFGTSWGSASSQSGQSAPPPSPSGTARPLELHELVPGWVTGARSRAVLQDEGPSGPPLTVTVSPGRPTSTAFGAGNVGLSLELEDLADPRWDHDPALALLVAGLGRPTLRFGGNSADRRVFWTSTGEAAPPWAHVTLTPADVERLGRFAARTGVDVIATVDLGHNDPLRAADFAAHLASALGDRLIGISIGNEPNGFNLASQPQYRIRDDTWGPSTFLAQARQYEAAIHRRTPGIPLVGPGVYDMAWIRPFAAARLPQLRALTQHWYPLWACRGEDQAATPMPANLLNPALSRHTAQVVSPALALARSVGLPLWMEETGPTSCAGTNPTSRTHAQALWTVEYLLHLAQLGVQRTALHASLANCVGGAPMSPVCTRDDVGEGTSALQGSVGYLGAALVAQIQPGRFIPARVSGPDSAAVIVYAVADASGVDVVVVDLRDPTGSAARPLTVAGLSGQRLMAASRLAGPAPEAVGSSVFAPLTQVSETGLTATRPGSATLLRFTPSVG